MKTKLITLTLAAVLTGSISFATQNSFRTFTSRGGTSFSAKILDFDSISKKILLMRDNHQSAWIPLSALAPQDILYVENWCKSLDLLADENFKLTTEQKITETRSHKEESCWIKKDPCSAEISLEYDAQEPLKDARVEYSYYVASSSTPVFLVSKDKKTVVVDGIPTTQTVNVTNTTFIAEIPPVRVEKGCIELGLLPVNAKRRLKANSVILQTNFALQSDVSIFGSGSSVAPLRQESVVGVRVTVYGASSAGILASREFCFPENLDELLKQYPSK